tara:strand:+ start:431 stop:889 length:459 start_codon:yes stop_codon:yes gene_type:complete
MLNIGYGSKNPLEKKLSNFNPLPFTFDGVTCTCLEGPLQAFKCADWAEQVRICGLDGKAAKKAGRSHNDWKDTQMLHWNGVVYQRSSQNYQDLLDRLYDVAFAASAELHLILQQTGNERLIHTIGSHDTHDTVLTVLELTSRLYELRDRLRT